MNSQVGNHVRLAIPAAMLLSGRMLENRGFLRESTVNDPIKVVDASVGVVVSCESNPSAEFVAPPPPPPPSWWRRTLSSMHLASLPIPRTLLRQDPAFSDAQLRRGLRKRQRDEQSLRSLQGKIQKAHQAGNNPELGRLFALVTEIAYGKGVSPQQREDFLVRYGCTGWTEEALESLLDIGLSRGFVEIGAGHGQWARALTEAYDKRVPNGLKDKYFEFVLAYDNMKELPLSTQVYHQHTQQAHDFFYKKVKKMDSSVDTILRQWSCRGRILLLVYPPPGSMALETIQSYVSMGPENDTVVYVGEGRGGCNADNELFDYLELNHWTLECVVQVQSQPGGKGFEKCFILKRPKVLG